MVRRARTLRRHIVRICASSARITAKEFDLSTYDERRCLRDFRFLSVEITERLVPFFAWNRERTTRNRYRCNDVLATCVVLRRLASPARWEDLAEEFGKYPAQLSEVFWEALENMVRVRGYLILNWRADLMEHRAALYASHIHENAPLPNCVGFMDCTKQKVARPGGHNSNQRALYTGHKRTWCLKWQSVSTPDGLIFHLWGPEDGRRHNSTLYNKSGIDSILEDGLLLSMIRYCIYADAAYVLRPWLQVAFARVGAAAEGQAYNTYMNAGRTSVEWSYEDTRQSWTSLDFHCKMKVREAPVVLLNIGGMLLWNLFFLISPWTPEKCFFGIPSPPPHPGPPNQGLRPWTPTSQFTTLLLLQEVEVLST